MQFLTTLIMITAFAASAIEVSAGPVSFDPTKMICLVNKFRAEKKLPPLAIDTGLNKAAQDHSVLQARNNQMSHSFAGEPGLMQRCSASGGGWNSVSENVASGQTSIEQVMNSWIASPLHLKNLVSDATHFGSGMALGNGGQTYWTQDFGRNDKLPKSFPKC
ncbi:CAP domain-containing protein [Syncephalis fuscata]|nr:CAP domain-containing protein [Syncephalis fuscata]KAI9596598.1 CAP domain-containing protein [Syncephalis fuscata]KAI9596611.1 CAP domain-containing protein [Syncephalis fuscata]KAI9596612.1 CAP domain-containing protein [Syncephalis fuscata]